MRSLERDGELRAQLNLQAASLSSIECVLYMFVYMLAFSVLAPSLAPSLSLDSKHICGLSETNYKVCR